MVTLGARAWVPYPSLFLVLVGRVKYRRRERNLFSLTPLDPGFLGSQALCTLQLWDSPPSTLPLPLATHHASRSQILDGFTCLSGVAWAHTIRTCFLSLQAA